MHHYNTFLTLFPAMVILSLEYLPSYEQNSDAVRASKRRRYEQNSDEIRASKRQKYQRNSVTNKVSKRSAY